MIRIILLSVILVAIYIQLCSAYLIPRRFDSKYLPKTATLSKLTSPHRSNMVLNGVMSGISEKLGGIVELISGQSVITEANIEDTLKV